MFDHVPGGWELLLILAVGVMLFGSKRLPDSARSIGRSLRIFKSEMAGLRSDDPSPAPVSPQPAPPAPGTGSAPAVTPPPPVAAGGPVPPPAPGPN